MDNRVSRSRNEPGLTGTLVLYIKFFGEQLQLLLYTVWFVIVQIVKLVMPQSRKSLKNEIILVTGGANGIGREICHRLVKTEQSLTIVIWDVDEVKIQAVIEELQALGIHKAVGFKVDLGDRIQVATGAKTVREQVGDVTMLFNNVGIVSETGNGWALDPERFEKVIKINLTSHCWTLAEFIPPMIAMGKGHIVETCSIMGLVWGRYGSPYVASKHGLRAFVETVKEDIRHHPSKPKIHFTLVYPDFTNTALTDNVHVYSSKYPFLHKYLEPSYVAQKTVEGVLLNEEHVYVPKRVRLMGILYALLPPAINRKIIDTLDVQAHLEPAPVPNSQKGTTVAN